MLWKADASVKSISDRFVGLSGKSDFEALIPDFCRSFILRFIDQNPYAYLRLKLKVSW